MIAILSGIVLIVLALVIWQVFFSGPRIPNNVIPLSGRVEGDDSAVGPQTGGRVLEIRVREGDTVSAGDVIAVLSDDQIRAREDQARAGLREAEDKARAAREQVSVLQEQLRQSQLQAGQSKLDTEGHVRQAEADLAAAQADLAEQEAAYQIAAFDKEAYSRLAKSGAVSERQGLQAAATADQQAAAVAASKRRVEASQGALTAAQADLSNPEIRESQTSLVRRQISQQQAEIAGAVSQIAQARAQLAEAETSRQYLTVKAPFTGTVTTRAAEPGEVLTTGTPVITLIDLTKVYLRGFIPEGQIGRVKVGQPAHIFLDSNPDQAIDAYVSRIDPEATFTPENTYFRDERVKEVVGVKLQLKEAFGFAKPGMPADGEILVEGQTWPQGKRRP
ncbi:MAG TPA: HlyD family efflux transporter periplasmic adaptor subunit [Candidatus Acidoferrales bacterium]|jgi:HlyD family secretion protein|nr:HlyD family efflux transporter periplasmic adaptor subunit [Candidatus Acidoferrales bacterium]